MEAVVLMQHPSHLPSYVLRNLDKAGLPEPSQPPATLPKITNVLLFHSMCSLPFRGQILKSN